MSTRLLGWVHAPGVALVVAAGTALSGDPGNRGAVFYVVATVYSAYFFKHGVALAHLGFMAVTYGLALATMADHAAAADSFLFTMPMAAVTGVVVARLRDRLIAQAKSDWLTGAWNRRGFEERLAGELAGGARLGLMLVDADDFKGVNDLGGHHAGDTALRAIASALADTAGGPEFVARLGGDEFAMLLPGCGEDEVVEYAEALRSRLAEDDAAPTVSIGVASGTGDPGELMRVADAAVYAAKRSGRDRVVAASAASQIDEAARRAELARALAQR